MLKNETPTLYSYGVDTGDKKAQIVIRERRMTTSYLKNVQSEGLPLQQVNDQSGLEEAWRRSSFGDSGGPVFNSAVLGDALTEPSLIHVQRQGNYQRTDTGQSGVPHGVPKLEDARR